MLLGKSARFLLRLVRRGGGSALPGTIARVIQPNLLQNAIASAPLGLVVVTGTAGKSSTTKALAALLRAHGLTVFTNPSTANIQQGFFASILEFGNLRGQIKADVVVFEWDEGHGAMLSASLRPRLAIFTNVLSDQLDRFVDPELVAEKLAEIARNSEVVIVNSDDKNLTQFAHAHRHALGYGLGSKLLGGPLAPAYAINFGPEPLVEKAASLESLSGTNLTMRLNGSEFSLKQFGEGLPQGLNLVAAVLAAGQILPLDAQKVTQTIAELPVVFARGEIVTIRNRQVQLMLVQNPTSFQLNLEALSVEASPLMLMAGRDIHDPSWLWTVDFSRLKKVHVVSGYNAFDLALRLRYAGVEVLSVLPEIDQAVEHFFTLQGQRPTIIFSADAMRRTRRYLGLAK